MMGYGYGMGVGGWIAMTIFWVGLFVLVIWALSRAFPPRSGGEGGAPREPARDSAAEILDRRFAAGELDEETCLAMRATLRSADTHVEPHR